MLGNEGDQEGFWGASALSQSATVGSFRKQDMFFHYIHAVNNCDTKINIMVSFMHL